MSSDRTTTARTGWEVVALAQVGTSGLSGTIIIDWDKLTAATSYTCANWPEGALFAINLYKEGTTGGGGGTENIVISSVDTVDIDGSADQYVANPASADIEYTLKAFASMKGTVRINNISATYHVELFAAAAELATSTFNGTAQGSIIIEPKTYIEVAVYSEGVFYVKGTYTDTV
jgi:spore maturation protein SpmB